MKIFRKLLIGCLAGILSLSMIACSGSNPTQTEGSATGTSDPGSVASTDKTPDPTTPTTPNPTMPTAPAGPVNLTIAGVPLEQYTIVYADHPYGKSTRNLYTEYDFYKLIAEHIAGEITAQTGVTLQTARDTKTDTTDHEILVGPTNREESSLFTKMSVYDYTCKVDGTKLVVGGGYNSTSLTGNLKTSYCYSSTYHAWDYVKAYVTEHAGQSDSVDLDASFLLKGSREITTVACIGDSITEGHGSTEWSLNAYPAVLQRLLWQDYLVLNYGNCGKTMRDDLPGVYKGTPQYNAAKRYAAKFDLALIMLGTNDSNQDRSWTSADDATYNRCALDLASMLTKSNSDLKLVIMNCPVYYGSEMSGSPRVRYLQAGLVSLLTDAGYNTSFYNMHEYTATKLGKVRFPDALHPDDKGYSLMAEGLAEMIPACMAGSWVCEPEFPEDGKPAPALPDVEVPADSVNLLSNNLAKLYPVETSQYNAWHMGGAPYILKNAPNLSGSVVTNIELPIAGCKKGDKFTVSVVKYSFPNLLETLSTHTLTVDYDGDSGWLKFGGLNIEVPEGYTLAFGQPTDTIRPLYIPAAIPGYNFYGVPERTDNNGAAIAFNVYGKKDGVTESDNTMIDLPDVKIPADSVNLLSRDDLETVYPVGHSLYRSWNMKNAPYILNNAPGLSGTVVTNIEFPIMSCTKGSTFTVSVVKYNHPNIIETLSTHTLTVDFNSCAGWLKFGGLNIEVPEGYTLAFGKPTDTIVPLYIGGSVPGYGFYSTGEKVETNSVAILFNVYGKKN